jgi:hypothetical protein
MALPACGQDRPGPIRSYLAPSVIANKPGCPKGFASRVPPSEAPFSNGQTRRVRIGIAADFRAQAESLHAQFQSALLARD